jgi:prepilin-type N-terminal cleavage/methylation domain-containing protein
MRLDRDGFTLIEVMGALVIFAAGVLLATSLTSALSVQLRNATVRSEATLIGQALMDSLSAHATYGGVAAGASGSATLSILDRSYSRSWTAAQFGPRTRQVVVTVTSSFEGAPSFSGTIYLMEAW